MKKILVMASVMMLGAMSLQAAGTAAGTVVDNTAVLSYEVSGTPQDNVNSDTDTFVVDDKVDLAVTHQDNPIKTVAPGATAQVLEFTVTNEGNKVHDFLLTAGQNNGNPYGEAHPDQFDIDAAKLHVYVEDGTTPGYQVAEDTETYIDELAADGTATVYIVSDIPNPLTDGDVAEMTLTAQVAVGGTSGTKGAAIANDNGADADTEGSNPGDEQIVFADAAGANGAPDAVRDGKHGDTSAYKVKRAILAASKTSIITNDPTGSAEKHRVPGATIRYCFDVQNTGSGDADKVRLHDNFTTNNKDNLTYVKSGVVINAVAAACDCAVNANTDGTAAPATDIYIPDAAAGVTVPAGGNACAYIEATINQ